MWYEGGFGPSSPLLSISLPLSIAQLTVFQSFANICKLIPRQVPTKLPYLWLSYRNSGGTISCSPQTEALRHGLVHFCAAATLNPKNAVILIQLCQRCLHKTMCRTLNVPSLAKLQWICLAIWTKILVPFLMSHWEKIGYHLAKVYLVPNILHILSLMFIKTQSRYSYPQVTNDRIWIQKRWITSIRNGFDSRYAQFQIKQFSKYIMLLQHSGLFLAAISI